MKHSCDTNCPPITITQGKNFKVKHKSTSYSNINFIYDLKVSPQQQHKIQ